MQTNGQYLNLDTIEVPIKDFALCEKNDFGTTPETIYESYSFFSFWEISLQGA